MLIIMSYPFEPYKIKVLDQIRILSKAERTKALHEADYNLFKVSSDKITIDLLTDSGTSALSQEQWSRIMLGDEAYASSKSWERLEASVKSFSGRKEIIPVHQGRAAEKIIAETILKNGDMAVANGFFDTTRANFEHRGVTCLDIPSEKSLNRNQPTSSGQRPTMSSRRPKLFKGDMDIKQLKKMLARHRKKISLIQMTLTNNTGGGQPASLKNVEIVSQIARKNNIKFLIDACRIAENAYFIWLHEQQKKGSVKSIIRKLFSLSDLAFVSAKKDGLANSGGFITTNDRSLAAKIKELTILYEGYVTYGGMTGRDMEAIAQGLEEVVNPAYLEHRINQVAYLHQKLDELGVPLIRPSGGHAVYVDAGKFFSHIPKDNFPGQALVVALYQEGGIRSVEIGSLMLGVTSKPELVRLALPRRTYTQPHFDYVAETFKKIITNKKRYKGFEIVWQPSSLRHFTCKLKPQG